MALVPTLECERDVAVAAEAHDKVRTINQAPRFEEQSEGDKIRWDQFNCRLWPNRGSNAFPGGGQSLGRHFSG